MSSLKERDENRPLARDRARNGRSSVLNGREKPLFTGPKHRQTRSQDVHPRFFTDSLNTSFASHIPSPSPARPTYTGRPRQVRGSGNGAQTNVRGIAAAYNTLGSGSSSPGSGLLYGRSPGNNNNNISNYRNKNKNNNNYNPASRESPTSSTPSPVNRNANATGLRGHNHRHSYSQSHIPSPQPHGQPQRFSQYFSHGYQNRTHTPSPTRGRQLAQQQQQQQPKPFDPLQSPASDSSPPHGLAESYRRIEDEEVLASQGEEYSDGYDEEGDVDFDTTDDLGGEGKENILLKVPGRNNGEKGGGKARSRTSASPDSRRSSRRLSPLLDLALVRGQSQDRASVEGKKGDAGGEESKRDKAEERGSSPFEENPYDVAGDVASQQERDHERVRSALSGRSQPFKKARDRKAIMDSLRREDGGSQSGSVSTGSRSMSSKTSEISLNVPNGWGRKGKTGKSLLNRITEGSSIEAESPSLKIDSIEDWVQTAAATPLPDINSDSLQPSYDSPVPEDRPYLLAPIRAPSEDSRERSTTPTNTPPRRLRTNIIDSIRDRELLVQDELEDKDELPAEPSIEGFVHLRPGLGRTLSEELEGFQEPSDEEDEIEEAAIQGLVNEAAPRACNPVTQITERRPLFNERPKHVRGDSREILRSLSRAESKSPSPTPQPQEKGKNATAENKLFMILKNRLQNPVSIKPREPVSRLAPAQTPAQEQPMVHHKTPMVTAGAWVDTPMPTVKEQKVTAKTSTIDFGQIEDEAEVEAKDVDLAQANKEAPIKLEDTAPKLSGSALADILDHARARQRGELSGENDDTLLLSDSEIESLADLVETSDNEALQKAKRSEDQVTKNPLVESQTNSLSEAIKSEILMKDPEMYNKLMYLHSSIQDTNKDLGKLQRRLSSSSGAKLQKKPTDDSTDDLQCHEGGEMHDFVLPCATCADRERSLLHSAKPPRMIEWQTLRIPAPRLWTWKTDARLPRLTKLGMWVLLLAALFVAESIVSDAYTPPFSASSMRGYEFGVDCDMPRPPFILAKLTWRNGLARVLEPVWVWTCILGRAFSALFGVNPGIFGHASDALDLGAKYVAKEVWDAASSGSVGVSWAEDVGMGADEYL